MVDSLRKGQISTSMVIIAIVAALGLVGIVTFTIVIVPQQVEAKGCGFTTGLFASGGKCATIPNGPHPPE